MTTAHRPTFDPARGKEAARGEAYHQRLLPAHKTLKFRQQTQGTADEQAKRDLKAELLRAERAHFAKVEGKALPEDEDEDEREVKGAIEAPDSAKRKIGDVEAAEGGGEKQEDYEAKKRRVLEETKDIDASSSGSEADSDSESESESEDESAELMRELAKIKAERAAAAAAAAEKEAAKEAEQREKDIALGNPLLNKAEYGVKRRWDDDVVFKNQARGTEERGKEKRFVNDLLRSDFHRRFMDKYVR
ncbi:complexed with cef1p [Saxophila tyrrhenica]|uniref:Complexed with cef1p n=1 Tax=Saxophila tyrrhenica TaxID=1690608 RepID=A0AAV9PM27_9PEZI|nr:complexed with cef1p [Saxophila tyrrhenica]